MTIAHLPPELRREDAAATEAADMASAGAHSGRPAWADIDLDAITHNARELCAASAPAQLCAVVKANGYGHGAIAVALAALRGGATWLGVALVEEGIAVRCAGIDAPILVLSEPPPAAMADVVQFRAHPGPLYPGGAAGCPAGRRGWPARPRWPCTSRSIPACTGSGRRWPRRCPWPRRWRRLPG